VRPLHYFAQRVSGVEEGVKRVVITAGSHRRCDPSQGPGELTNINTTTDATTTSIVTRADMDGCPKSFSYLAAIQLFLEDLGFEVTHTRTHTHTHIHI
jgi:hypothetical protein